MIQIDLPTFKPILAKYGYRYDDIVGHVTFGENYLFTEMGQFTFNQFEKFNIVDSIYSDNINVSYPYVYSTTLLNSEQSLNLTENLNKLDLTTNSNLVTLDNSNGSLEFITPKNTQIELL